MAHLVESMMSVKQTPWHGLGTILEAPPTAEDAIVAAGLDWQVEKRRMHFEANDLHGNMLPSPDRYAVVRTKDNEYLGDAGAVWQPLQNKEAFRFFDPFVQSGEATYETAGSLEGGRTIWVLAKINRSPIEVVKGDTVDKYVLLVNKHKAGYSIQSTLTPIRVVCNNTLTGAVNRAEWMLKAHHSKKTAEKLEDIQEVIARADSSFKNAAEAYRMFAKKAVNNKIIDQILADTFEWSVGGSETDREASFRKKQTETIMRLFETGRGTDIKGVNGTVWGLYNAITEFVQHEKGKVEDKRLKDAWFGSGMAMNNRAFTSALRMAA